MRGLVFHQEYGSVSVKDYAIDRTSAELIIEPMEELKSIRFRLHVLPGDKAYSKMRC